MTEKRDYFPRQWDAEEPAPDGATWEHCGHPKTASNTVRVGKGRVRCRLCRRKINRLYQARRAGKG